ncbi:MAG: doubled motif LPXTG anchor domain-containing protein, partial [Clostridiales bacterium]|nr:doubled motif LPXTG anchor domain-containing protein [Clostridiales bacterium]
AKAAAGYSQESLKWDTEPEGYVIKAEGTQLVFTVTFTEAEQTYTVQYIDEDTKEGLAEQEVKTAKYGDYITGAKEAKEFTGYTFTTATDLRVTEYNESNYVFVYYSKDDNGDQIPDKYQVVFTYVTENPTYGTVNGTNSVTEVVTRPKNDDGSYDMDAEVYPSANVTADGLGRYYFDYWTDGIRNYADTTEIHATGFTDDTTFTAMFEYRGGNGGGGGGNGGGSGGGGGGHYTGGSEGGPGAATTITPEEVPLAPLPEDVTISDELVPLAPLPKTGQTAKSAITMMFSGILLALTAMSRKRKEEDV